MVLLLCDQLIEAAPSLLLALNPPSYILWTTPVQQLDPSSAQMSVLGCFLCASGCVTARQKERGEGWEGPKKEKNLPFVPSGRLQEVLKCLNLQRSRVFLFTADVQILHLRYCLFNKTRRTLLNFCIRWRMTLLLMF